MPLNGLGSLMTVHHLNCGSISLPVLDAVTHVLLCEYQHGAVLIDVGLGRADVDHPVSRIGIGGKLTFGAFDRDELAVNQLAAMGIAASDVSGIVATHLDFDHVGGVSDFPNVAVLVHERERDAAFGRRSFKEHERYRKSHLADLAPVVEGISTPACETLPFGMRGTALDDSETLWLLPLSGHTRGHSAIGVRTADGWLVHAGDSFFSVGTVRPDAAVEPAHRRAEKIERLLAMDKTALASNHSTLRDAAGRGAVVICSHDRTQYEELAHR
ncbi:MBL fold metallo-hydrolase [Gordonia otitidis]|uniref:Metallo-beta-lactamase domain-containing protein n=1 Tax=Gordonia otitidis (strain DSM 44809 / CCUG 52243 / JCM 12355 / NBRC 100426 / IFM 10032) TaxID=1108044 RepID=H5TSC1_GORO1|nr:MBL fold metallo-hydrolase [Gordonia otitidis]GAB36379.1 hypothetical protein GOOTI_214_00050 [Gordonia otitidis NBRC 100426]